MKTKLTQTTAYLLKMRYVCCCALFILLAASYSFGQVPNISYPSPQIYTAGVAITPLVPSNSGGPVSATTTDILASGLNYPNGVAVDVAGNVYVADAGNNDILKIPAGGGAPVTIGAGFNFPLGITVDIAGNVYVTNTNSNTVIKIKAGNSGIGSIGSGFHNPGWISLDRSGNIYVCDVDGIKKMPPGGGAPVLVITPPSGHQLRSIALDSANNIYYLDVNTNQIEEKLAAGGATITVTSEPVGNLITGIAVDAAGNVYYADDKYGYITKFTPGTGQKSQIGGSFVLPQGIALDAKGRIYVGDVTAKTVSRITSGGYSISPNSPALPHGLNLDTNTGVISGTPTSGSAATDYMVMAYNSSGTSSTTINLAITTVPKPAISYNSPDAYQINNKITTLLPANTGGAISTAKRDVIASNLQNPYSIAVDASGNSYCVESKTNDVRMIPAGGGASTVISAGFVKPLGIAVDGSGNVYVDDFVEIKEIFANGGPTWVFDAGDLYGSISYGIIASDGRGSIYAIESLGDFRDIVKFPSTGEAPPDLGSIGTSLPTGIAVDQSGNVYVTSSAGDIFEVQSGTYHSIKLINTGTNIVSSAADASGNVYFIEHTGNTLSMYVRATGKVIVLVNRGVAQLKGIAADANGNVYVTNYLTGEAVKITTSGYYVDKPLPAGLVMDKATGAITGTATVTSPATIYNVTAINSGGTGSTSFSLSVLANSTLSSLVPSVSHLGPPFEPRALDYSMDVASSVTSITFTPATTDSLATVTVNGVTVASGTASAAIPLTTGDNAVHVVVTATDGSTSTYSVLVTRVPSGNYYLATLLASNGILSPTFTHLTNNYTTQVGAYVASMTVTPTVVDSTATITVNGTPLTSGATSAEIPLIVGVNPINIAVTAQNGTVNTYTINVTRVPSTNAYLMRILLNHGYDVPLFSHLIFNYATPVPNGVSAIKVTPVGAVSSSTITVNGAVVVSGTASGDIPLAVGVNNISILVTAQDGVTQNTYTVTVTREPPSLNTVYQPVGVATTNGINQINEDGLLVHNGLSPNGDGVNDFLLIDGIANYPENKLQIMTRNGQLIFEAKNYDNSNKVFDGHSNKTGQRQLPGTYFYSLDYTVNGVVRHKTGFVVLKY